MEDRWLLTMASEEALPLNLWWLWPGCYGRAEPGSGETRRERKRGRQEKARCPLRGVTYRDVALQRPGTRVVWVPCNAQQKREGECRTSMQRDDIARA